MDLHVAKANTEYKHPFLAHRDAADCEALEGAERIWTFARRDDPRLTAALVSILDAPPFIAPREPGNGVEEFWCAVFDTLRGLGDRRARDPILRFGEGIRAICADVDDEAQV